MPNFEPPRKARSLVTNLARFKSRPRPKYARRNLALGVESSPHPGSQRYQNQGRVSPEEFCLVSFKKTKNNAHLNLSRPFGDRRSLVTFSAGRGSLAPANGRRKTRWSQRLLFQRAFEKLVALGFTYLIFHVSGPTVSKRYLYKHYGRRFKLVLVKDITGVPHNGCRPPSLRRK